MKKLIITMLTLLPVSCAQLIQSAQSPQDELLITTLADETTDSLKELEADFIEQCKLQPGNLESCILTKVKKWEEFLEKKYTIRCVKGDQSSFNKPFNGQTIPLEERLHLIDVRSRNGVEKCVKQHVDYVAAHMDRTRIYDHEPFFKQ